MEKRLNNILSGLAQQYAYHILHNAPKDARRLEYLATGLADNGFLVILADIPANNYDFMLNTWASTYINLYDVISSNLFPLFTGRNLWMPDALLPPVVVIQGQTPAVIQVLAGYIVPYIALCQKTKTSSEAEIRGLMTYILDELETEELERAQYNAIWRQCTQLVHQLVTMPIQQHTLTPMKKNLFQRGDTGSASISTQKPRPARPKTLPETGNLDPRKVNGAYPDKKLSAKKKTGNLSSAWFGDDDSDEKGHFPPVPGLKPPDEDK